MNPLRIFLHLAVSMASVAIAASLLPGVAFAGFLSLFLATIVLGIINTLIRPLVMLVTLPINVLTLGLFGLVVNALFVMLAAQVVDGFTIASFWWALAFSILLTIVHWFLHLLDR
jgi:putative membrane protein